MVQDFYLNIEKNLSKDRLDNYGKMDNADRETVVARYLWNIAISQSLYQLLHFFEILLRNKINNAFIASVGQVDWYNKVSFDKYTEDMINNAMEKLNERKISYDNGHLVAELNLGFWTSLFNKYNSQYSFQGKICKSTFSNCPPDERKTKKVYKDLEKIRLLRNRVSHYERIIHWKDLPEQHDLILKLIRYMDKEFCKRIIPLDTFNEVLNSGIDEWKEKASKFMQVEDDIERKQIQANS